MEELGAAGECEGGLVPVLALHKGEGGGPTNVRKGGGEKEEKLAAEAGGFVGGEGPAKKGDVEFFEHEADALGIDVEFDARGGTGEV